MGNCLARKALQEKISETPREDMSRIQPPQKERKQKKTVRFKLDNCEEEAERRRQGGVRIMVVMKRDELRQILEGGEPLLSSSQDALLLSETIIRLGSIKRRMVPDDEPFSPSNGVDFTSTPALESIQEDL